MRKVETLVNSSYQILLVVEDFLSKFPDLYTLVYSSGEIRVFYNIKEKLYLIFYSISSSKIKNNTDYFSLFVSTEYDSSKEVWYQKDIICSGMSSMESDYVISIPKPYTKYQHLSAAYYFSAPTIRPGSGGTIVLNYNAEGDTFMITSLLPCVFDYEVITRAAQRSESIVFGTLNKYTKYDGGFFYGGDFINTYERYYRELHTERPVDVDHGEVDNKDDNPYDNIVMENTPEGNGLFCIHDDSFKDIEFHKQPPPLGGSGFWSYPWCDNPYRQFDCACRNVAHFPEPNRINRFGLILRIDVDYYPHKKTNKIVDMTEIIKKSNVPKIERPQIWAVTMDIGHYVHMVCSLTNSTVLVPRYEPLLSHDFIEQGHNVNTLNNISTLMPLWCMVRRDPVVLNNYSGVGGSNVINFVDMFNMRSDRLDNDTFGIYNSHIYNCFHMGNRRAMYGMKGYSGIAFKQETNKLYLLDLPEMEKHKRDSRDELLTFRLGTDLCYDGTVVFSTYKNLTLSYGSFILNHPYTAYSSIVFDFCDGTGRITDTIVWTKTELDTAFNDKAPFNLIPPTSPIALESSPGAWWVKPFSDGSTTVNFLCSPPNNCVLTGIHGVL